MTLILAIDIILVAVLLFIALKKGVEAALPWTAFFLVLLPGESRFVVPGLFDLTSSRIVIVTILIAYLVFGSGGGANRKHVRRTPLKWLLAFYLVWLAISTADSAVFMTSFKATLSQLLDYFLIYYIFVKSVNSTETVRKIMLGMVAAMAVCGIMGYFEAYFGWSVIHCFPVVGYQFGNSYVMISGMGRGYRIRTTFGHAILYGSALAFTIPWVIYFLSDTKRQFHRVLLWSCLLLMCMNIYKTASRGPWLALAISLALLLLLGRNADRKRIGFLIALSLAVLIIRPGTWDTIDSMYDATVDANSPMGESYQYRYQLLDLAHRTLSKSFGRALWGYGPGSFFFLHLQGVNPDTGHTFTYESCDSSVAELAIDTGYVGFLIVALLLARGALTAFKNFLKLPRLARQMSLLLFINIVAFAFMMTSVAIYGWGQQTYMLWIFIALAMALPQIVRTTASEGSLPVDTAEAVTEFAVAS